MRTNSQHMNPVTDEPPPPPPVPVPLQPPRSSFRCDRHREDNFTGFCTSCLSERLNIIDQSTAASSSIAVNATAEYIRRTKSFSATRHEELGLSFAVLEPQRKSVGVTGGAVLATNDFNDEVRVCKKEEAISDLEGDILEMEAKIDAIVENLKCVNDQIDLDHVESKIKKPSFWSKKWGKWKPKQKEKKKKIVEDVSSRKLKTPEIADYGFEPRFSLDAGRVSLDETRGWWNGRSLEEAIEPGGSTQTREYYLSRRRKGGLERSNSIVASIGIHRRIKSHSIGAEKELVSSAIAGEKKSTTATATTTTSRWWNWKVWSKNDGELTNTKQISDSLKDKCQGDDGLLRFYFTPLRGSRRKSAASKSNAC